MQTTTLNTNCLSFEQLQSYSLNKSELKERAQLYLHISTCELCACAVNGFTAISFTSAEVDAIHHRIDLKTNALHANPLTFAQVFIACVSVVSIFGFYQFAESFYVQKTPAQKTELIKSEPVRSMTTPAPVEEFLPYVEPLVAGIEPATTEEPVERISTPVEPLSSITPEEIPLAPASSELIVETTYNSNVIYIYDLKVSDYNALYFNYAPRSFEISGHTPAFKENKKTGYELLDDAEEVVAADKTLKSGLASFSKGKYEAAIASFSVLLENNPWDVNALFYSAVSYHHIGEYRHTIKNLEKVLRSDNTVFHPEAKWNLALSYLKAGDKRKAKQLFSEISSDRGFYSAKATEKLKGL